MLFNITSFREAYKNKVFSSYFNYCNLLSTIEFL